MEAWKGEDGKEIMRIDELKVCVLVGSMKYPDIAEDSLTNYQP